MWNVTAFLYVLVGAAVPLGFLDRSVATGLAGALASLCLLLAMIAIRPGELAFLKSTTRAYVIAGLAVLLWTIVQMLPMPWLANPVWTLAGEMLGRPLSGSISIDTGATLGALLTYLAGFCISIAAAAAAVDPRRAAALATAVAGTTALSALLLVMQSDPVASWLHSLAPILATKANGLFCAALAGIPVCVAMLLDEPQAGGAAVGGSGFLLRRLLLIAAALLGTASACWYGGAGAAIPIVAGLALLAFTYGIRRFRLPHRTSAAAGLAVAAIAIATAFAERHPDVALAAAFTAAPDDILQATHSLLVDLPILGSGAGTIGALAPTYMDWQESATSPIVASAASAMLAEFGPLLFWSGLLAAVLGICALVAGALDRRRDWSFAAAGACALLSLTLAAFILPDVLSLPGIIVLSAVTGNALAQRVSRSRLQAGQ